MDTLFPVSGGVSAANVVVEDARPQDMAAVQAIYAPHVLQGLATFEEQPPSVDEMARRHEAVLALGSVQQALDGKTPKKVIVVPQRIVNIVV